MEIKYCCECGAKLPATAKFCSSCGEKQISVDDISTEPVAKESGTPTVNYVYAPVKQKKVKVKKEKKPSNFNKKGLIPLIRNGVITLIAIFMLIMAFMPVSRLSVSDAMGISSEEIPDIGMNITPIRAIDLMFSSMKNEAQADIEDDLFKILEEIEEDYEDVFEDLYYDDWEDLKSSQREAILEIMDTVVYKSYKLALTHEEMVIPAQVYITGALSLAYLCAAVALLVMAILNMLSTFNIIRSENGALLKWTITLLALIPVFVVVLNYAYYLSFAGIGGVSGANGSSIAGSGIAVLIVSGLAIAGLFALRLIFMKERKIGVMIKRGVALAISIVVICLAFSPIVNTTVKVTPANLSDDREFEYSVNAPYFVSYGYMIDEEWDEYIALKPYASSEKQDYINGLIEEMELFTKKELESPQGDMLNIAVVSSLYFALVGDIMAIAPLLMLFQLVAVLGAGIVMWQMLRYFAGGKIDRAFLLSGRLVTVVFAALTVAANIILAVLLANATNRYAPVEFSCAIAIGVFFFLAFAIAMLVLPVNAKKCCEEDTIPVSMFCKKAECGCCCEAVCDDAPIATEGTEEAPVSEDIASNESDEEIAEADGEPDEQDIEDLKAIDGDVE